MSAFIFGLKSTLEFWAGTELQFNTLCFWLSHQSPKNFNLPAAQLKHSLRPIPHTDPMGFGTLHACCIQTAHKAHFLPSVLSRWDRRLTGNAGFVFWWPLKKVSGSELSVLKDKDSLVFVSQAQSSDFFATPDCSCDSAVSHWKEDTVNKI